MSLPAPSEDSPDSDPSANDSLPADTATAFTDTIRAHGPLLLLALALLVGAWFRFTGLDWDAGTHLHPTSATSRLRPPR